MRKFTWIKNWGFRSKKSPSANHSQAEFSHLLENHQVWVNSLAKASVYLDICDTNFEGFDFTDAQLERSQFDNVSFRGANLNGTSFFNASISSCNFTDSVATGVCFIASKGFNTSMLASGSIGQTMSKGLSYYS